MRKNIVVTLVVATIVVLAVGLLSLSRCMGTSTDTEIGVVLPLSGDMAEFGENARNGLVLAQEELERDGFRVRLVVQDSQGTPPGTAASVRRLVDINRVQFIIGGLTSSGVLAAAPYAQERGVLFFSPAASAPGIPEIGPLVFRNWQSDSALATMFATWTHKTLGIASLRILHVSNDYGQTNARAFQQRIEELGGSIVTTRAFSQGEADFRNLLTELGRAGPSDAVLIVAYPDEYRGIFRELARQPLGGTLLVTDTFYSPELLAQLGEAASGVYCATAAKPDHSYLPRREFIQHYRARFKDAAGSPRDPGLVSDTAYDALHLIAAGIRNTDGSPVAVGAWLLERRAYAGASGPTEFTAAGDFLGGLTVFRVEGGAFVPAKQ